MFEMTQLSPNRFSHELSVQITEVGWRMGDKETKTQKPGRPPMLCEGIYMIICLLRPYIHMPDLDLQNILARQLIVAALSKYF